MVRASNGTRCRAAENIKYQLQEQGIIVNIIYADDNLYNSYLNNVNYDMMLCSIEQPIAPDLNTYFGYNNYSFEKENLLEFKVNFNDITMRELGLDIDENNHVYVCIATK